LERITKPYKMNLTEQKTNFEKQLAEAIAKSDQLATEIKLIKSKLKKLDKIMKQAETL
jgi:hypothetical protein